VANVVCRMPPCASGPFLGRMEPTESGVRAPVRCRGRSPHEARATETRPAPAGDSPRPESAPPRSWGPGAATQSRAGAAKPCAGTPGLTLPDGRVYDPRRPDFGRASRGQQPGVRFVIRHLTVALPGHHGSRLDRSLGVRSSVNNKPTYLSREGEAELRRELAELVGNRRAEVAARIHDAKEHGDLSENAEYEEAKNEQAFVEGRIQTLEGMLKTAVIIENSGTEHVALGSVVEVESSDGTETFTIVGSAEARPAQGRISNESPVGRALLGRKAGEKVTVKLPNGSEFTYTITSIG